MVKVCILLSTFFLLLKSVDDQKVRYITFRDQEVKTTFMADQKYYGIYKGNKRGFLSLEPDGRGEYLYDIFGFAPSSCKPDTIHFNYGFLLNDNDEIVRFEREYGYSIPILYEVTGSTSFQGCSKQVFLDYLMEYPDGTIGVSSSDNWTKKP
jgi:hypothetical protein